MKHPDTNVSNFSGKNVLVTGACGTVGMAILKKLTSLDAAPSKIIALDNNESELFFCKNRFQDNETVEFLLCDIRGKDDLIRNFSDIDIVLHCAALKHVIINEFSPEQAVQTNIIGTQNVIQAAEACGVERVIFTSSDKAVNPTNVMGTSKLMGERLITAANAKSQSTIFASTRFGNVLGSNGSVVQILKRQLKDGLPLTITDTRMTRFVMSTVEAAELVLDSAFMVKGGEVLITKMPALKIVDLSEALSELLAPIYGFDKQSVETKIIGSKPGEKLYEELMSNEEMHRAVELEHYFSVLPAFSNDYPKQKYDYDSIVSREVEKEYNSQTEELLNVEEICALLDRYGLNS